MPTKIESNLKIVIDQFTPDILGVFWITNNKLSRELLGFDEFNYIFDGLISQYLYGQSEDSSEKKLDTRSNVFFTKNFNQNIFLVHLQMTNETMNILDDQITLIEGNKKDERNKIVLFNQTQKSWGSDLEKRYPQFEFISLELSNI